MTVEYIIGSSEQSLRTLPGGSVHFACTSPPYLWQRDYGDFDGQHGLEADVAAYVDRMASVFGELHRVLRDDGALMLNIGDKFNHKGKHYDPAYADKCLLMLPFRVAAALEDREPKWILRNVIPWVKASAMPSSAQDRMRCSWEPCFVFAKKGSYYSDVEAVRTAHADCSIKRGQPHRANVTGNIGSPQCPDGQTLKSEQFCNPAGANPGDVLTLGPQPSKLAHYAMYPVRLPLWFMRWLMPRRVCSSCGAPWGRVSETGQEAKARNVDADKYGGGRDERGGSWTAAMAAQTRKVSTTLRWQPQCDCGWFRLKRDVPEPVLDTVRSLM